MVGGRLWDGWWWDEMVIFISSTNLPSRHSSSHHQPSHHLPSYRGWMWVEHDKINIKQSSHHLLSITWFWRIGWDEMRWWMIDYITFTILWPTISFTISHDLLSHHLMIYHLTYHVMIMMNNRFTSEEMVRLYITTLEPTIRWEMMVDEMVDEMRW